MTVHFDNGRTHVDAPEGSTATEDRLQVTAVFADIDRRDLGLLAGLAGQVGQGAAIADLDTCIRQPEATRPLGAAAATRPVSWVQLLDVGNVELRAGDDVLPLRVAMVPAVIESVRGVRYDVERDRARMLLASRALVVSATGGDGIAPFTARIEVPRPVRVTHVGAHAVRNGMVDGLGHGEELRLRWGSVDGRADLAVRVGSEEPGSLGWLRCRLRDDGEFTVPAALTASLPPRSVHRPWLIVLERHHVATVAGFSGTPLRLELTDSVHVH